MTLYNLFLEGFPCEISISVKLIKGVPRRISIIVKLCEGFLESISLETILRWFCMKIFPLMASSHGILSQQCHLFRFKFPVIPLSIDCTLIVFTSMKICKFQPKLAWRQLWQKRRFN